jgi:hypothetical protein
MTSTARARCSGDRRMRDWRLVARAGTPIGSEPVLHYGVNLTVITSPSVIR